MTQQRATDLFIKFLRKHHAYKFYLKKAGLNPNTHSLKVIGRYLQDEKPVDFIWKMLVDSLTNEVIDSTKIDWNRLNTLWKAIVK